MHGIKLHDFEHDMCSAKCLITICEINFSNERKVIDNIEINAFPSIKELRSGSIICKSQLTSPQQKNEKAH
jgi:hypothetical protein